MALSGRPVTSRLFDRRWRVVVNGREYLYPVDVAFEIEKSLDPVPNTVHLEMFNLNLESRKALEALNTYEKHYYRGQKRPKKPKGATNLPKEGRIPVEIEAGYADSRSLLFSGDLRRAVSQKKPDGTRVTTIEGEDGGRSFAVSRISHSLAPGALRIDGVRLCAQAMGVGLGNIRDVGEILGGSRLANGATIHGQAHEELRRLLRPVGVTYSIQNGVLQFVAVGQGLQRRAVVLSPTSGLIGTPEVSSTGFVTVECLMIPNISPGSVVQVVSDETEFSGFYIVHKATYKGNTRSSEWGARLELKPQLVETT